MLTLFVAKEHQDNTASLWKHQMAFYNIVVDLIRYNIW